MARPDPLTASQGSGTPGRLRVRLATEDDRAALQRFNGRLRRAGVRYQLPLQCGLSGEFRQACDGLPVYREMLIAEDGSEVRAGLLLYRGGLWESGKEYPFCWVQLPLSEGIVDSRHSMAILMLMKTVIASEARPMSLGLGSRDETYARLLMRLGWRHAEVPFVFLPLRVREVLRCLPIVRSRQWARVGARAVALVGLDRTIEATLALLRRRRRRLLRDCTVQSEPCFGAWSDEVYRNAREDYGAAVVRTAAALNVRYPPDDPRYLRLRVRRTPGGEELGWIVVIHGQLQRRTYFGDLHVGTLVDGFGRRADVGRLVQAGVDHLAAAGSDLIVANWSHAAWLDATKRSGFFSAPTNYFLFVAPNNSAMLDRSHPISIVHMTRGDNDGPQHLLPARQSTVLPGPLDEVVEDRPEG